MPSSGNHWFVAVDAKRGDGSRNQPFHDPWLALRSAEPDDCIHIAAGTYYGRYDRSSWIVDRPRLTILGGYSADFSQRTPWHTPSVFAAFSRYEVPREANLIAGRGRTILLSRCIGFGRFPVKRDSNRATVAPSRC